MWRSGFNQEGLQPKEQPGGNRDQTPTNFEKIQAMLSEKRDKVQDIANKHEVITNDIKEAIGNTREIALKFGETELNLYNKLKYINDVMHSYQQFASNVEETLNDPNHLQKFDWRQTETTAVTYKQKVNQFFNIDLREILYRCYNNGINEYNTISREITNNNNSSTLHEILAIENKVTEDKNFIMENWGSYDLEKREIRQGVFNLFNRLDENIREAKYLQQNPNIRNIYHNQEKFSPEKDDNKSQPKSDQYSYGQQQSLYSTYKEVHLDTLQAGSTDKGKTQLENLPKSIVEKLAFAVNTSKGCIRNTIDTVKVTKHEQIVLNAQEILLNNVNYPEQLKKRIRSTREKNNIQFSVSSISEALENLRQNMDGIKNTHLTEVLDEISKLGG